MQTERGRSLTAEEEQALFATWKRERCSRTRDAIIEAHLVLVRCIAREYRCTSVDRADLVAEGQLALLIAFEHFDETRGVRFATYARHWVHSAMKAYLGRSSNALGSLGRARTQSRQRRENPDACHPSRDLSLDAPLLGDGDKTLLDCLAAEEVDPTALIEGSRRARVVATVVAEVRGDLDARAKRIFDARFATDEIHAEFKVVDELATELGLSRERVRQLEERIRCRLANRLRPALALDRPAAVASRDLAA